MKLIVAGSTGFVAAELIRQALSHPAITSVIALGRRETLTPANAGPNTAEFQSVVCDNFQNYPENVRRKLAGADACIWTIAVTPSQLKTMTWEQTCTICRDYAIRGIETISELDRHSGISKPLRFIYISGSNSERDPTKKPWVLGDYCLMRGDTESRILAYAQQSKGKVEACVAKPGLIDGKGETSLLGNVAKTIGRTLIGLPKIHVREISATLLDQAVNGFEKDTLLNEDLIRIGHGVLQAEH